MLDTIRHLTSISTEKHIVIAFEKITIGDRPEEKKSGFYIAALDRANSKDTKDLYARADRIQDTTGCIGVSSLAQNNGIVTWVFSELTRNKGYRLCFGLYFEPGKFQTCSDRESYGKIEKISIEYFADGTSLILWDEQDPCGCGSRGVYEAH
ncbi:MAG: hypothetical protein ACRD5E_03210 [Nitrososphaeraceae archaeon]